MSSTSVRGTFGRHAEFDRARSHLVAGKGVVVRGSPRSGRTSFAAALSAAAGRQGAATLWLSASASLQQVELGALSTLLPTADPSQPPSTIETLSGLHSVLRHHGGTALTALFVDDAHLLDEMSAEVVLHAVSTRALTLVATVDAIGPLPEGLRRLIDSRFAEVVDLVALDRAAVADVVAALVGGPVSLATVELLWRWSAGVPGVLSSIVQAGIRRSNFTLVEGQWWWIGGAPSADDLRVDADVRSRGLSDAACAAFSCVVLAEWLRLDELHAVSGPTALLELEQAGLIRSCDTASGQVDAVTVRSADELSARAMTTRMTPLSRAVHAQRLLSLLRPPATPAEVIRAARLHLHAVTPTPADLMGRAVSAVRLSNLALAEEIAHAHHRRSPTLDTTLGLLWNRLEDGDGVGARSLLAQARHQVVSSDEAMRLVEAEVAIALFGDRDTHQARKVLRRVRATGRWSADPATQRCLDSLSALTSVLSARPDRAGALARRVIDDGSAKDVPHLRSTIAFVSSQLFAGRTSDAKRGAEEALRRADEMSTQLPTAQGILRAQLAFAGLWRGELGSVPNSDPLNGRWPAPPGMAPDGRDFEWALMAGIVAHQRGDHGQAVARLREAVVQQAAGKGIFHSEACAWLVVALCDDGSPAEAESVMQRFPTRHLAVVPGVVDWAAGALACANGRTSEGSRLLGRAAQEAASVGATLCEAWYLIEQADRAASDEGVSRLADLGDLLDAPLLQALCRTTVARAKGDTATMLGCSTTLAAAGLVARAVSVCRDVERMARHCDAPEQARSAARHRRQLQGDGCAAGRHPHLSVREEEVATLAAGGLSDRQIAARLIVSVRTVESHLASAYRKLGVASRAHLAGAL